MVSIYSAGRCLFLLLFVTVVEPTRASGASKSFRSNAKKAQDELKKLFDKGSSSKCFGALDMNLLRTLHSPVTAKNRLDIPVRVDKGTMHYVNFGAGTTGTRFLFGLFCDEFHISGTHYAHTCFVERKYHGMTKVSKWYQTFRNHIKAKNQSTVKPINEKRSLSSVIMYTLDAIHGGSYWTDTPVANLWADIAALRPWALALATYRDPQEWARRRLEEHSIELICQPKLWSAKGVLHPFDIVGCLDASSSLKDAFTFTKNITQKQFIEAYVKMNTVNAHIALQRNIPFLPICLFDPGTGSKENVTALLSSYGIKPVTSSAERVSAHGPRPKPAPRMHFAPRDDDGGEDKDADDDDDDDK